MEKIAAIKKQKPAQRKRKPAKGRKAKDLYAPDMSGGAPGTKPKPEPKISTGPKKGPTLHQKLDDLSKSVSSMSAPKKAPVPKRFNAKKLGLIAGGVAGTGILIKKVRDMRKQNSK